MESAYLNTTATGLNILIWRDHEDSDRFFSRLTEYITAEHTKQFISAICKEFEEDLIVVLDDAPYFQASAVTDLVARDDVNFVTLRSYSPELNLVEECWR